MLLLLEWCSDLDYGCIQCTTPSAYPTVHVFCKVLPIHWYVLNKFGIGEGYGWVELDARDKVTISRKATGHISRHA